MPTRTLHQGARLHEGCLQKQGGNFGGFPPQEGAHGSNTISPVGVGVVGPPLSLRAGLRGNMLAFFVSDLVEIPLTAAFV